MVGQRGPQFHAVRGSHDPAMGRLGSEAEHGVVLVESRRRRFGPWIRSTRCQRVDGLRIGAKKSVRDGDAAM